MRIFFPPCVFDVNLTESSVEPCMTSVPAVNQNLPRSSALAPEPKYMRVLPHPPSHRFETPKQVLGAKNNLNIQQRKNKNEKAISNFPTKASPDQSLLSILNISNPSDIHTTNMSALEPDTYPTGGPR